MNTTSQTKQTQLCPKKPSILRKINPLYLFTLLLLGSLIQIPMSQAAYAGNQEWTTQGPFAPQIKAIIVDPNNTNILYASTQRQK